MMIPMADVLDAAWSGLPAVSTFPGDPVLLCFSHLRWDFVFQRPQHLMCRAARDHAVIFWEEPVFGPGSGTGLHATRRDAGDGRSVAVLVPHLPADAAPELANSLQRDMLDAVLRTQPARRRTLWFYTPMMLAFADAVAADLVVYDCMDELSAFRGAPPEMLEREAALIARADLVFTGGRSLYEAKRDRHPAVHCFPSSIDAAHFAAARQPGAADPPDQAAIPHPRLGFFGVIDERMDLALVEALAAARPDWQFVLVGPVVKIDPASLPRRPNIHWLGGKRYEELPAYLAGWDLGLMPFARNESTRFISPTKTPEFLAAGLRVVSAPVRDVVRDYGSEGGDLVAIADGAAEFAVRAASLLQGGDPGWLARVDARLAQQSWDNTWAAMQVLMRGAAEQRGVQAETLDA